MQYQEGLICTKVYVGIVLSRIRKGIKACRIKQRKLF